MRRSCRAAQCTRDGSILSRCDIVGAVRDIPPQATTRIGKADFEALAHFRYRLRRFLRFSEEMTRRHGLTALQYLLLLQIKGFPGRDWATVGELAERLQAKQHGVVSLISRCELTGLVKRSISRSDRRRVEVRLTGKGEKYVERLALVHRAELASLRGEGGMLDLTLLSTMRQRPASIRPRRKMALRPGGDRADATGRTS
jgi:DNA-binding MarR family transcriptional regulator